MSRIWTIALLAGGLLFLDAPEAAAHKEVRTMQLPAAHHRAETRRAKHLPIWLQRNQAFRAWYKHSRLKKNRYLSWHQLFDIYRWERVSARRLQRSFSSDGYRGQDRHYRAREYRRIRHP